VSILQRDVGSPNSRAQLFDEAQAAHPAINTVLNNDGIDHHKDALAHFSLAPCSECPTPIDIDFSSVVHVSTILLPTLSAMSCASALINTSSALAVTPGRLR
jgi:short-subunit dehydrogenase involved in D-alanine esterification of teichoic acids